VWGGGPSEFPRPSRPLPRPTSRGDASATGAPCSAVPLNARSPACPAARRPLLRLGYAPPTLPMVPVRLLCAQPCLLRAPQLVRRVSLPQNLLTRSLFDKRSCTPPTCDGALWNILFYVEISYIVRGRRWALPGSTYGRGCLTVAGDAAHPMTPNLGQGGCTALEVAHPVPAAPPAAPSTCQIVACSKTSVDCNLAALISS